MQTRPGYEGIYDVCADASGTDSLIINRSSGVLRVQPGQRVLGLSVVSLPTEDAAVGVARGVIDTSADATGTVLVPEGSEAVVTSAGSSTVYVNVDAQATSEALLAKSFAKYAVDKFTALPENTMTNDLKDCVTSAQVVWNDANSLNDSTMISDGLTNAVDGYDSCHSFLTAIDTEAGGAAEAASETEETSGLVKAAGEVGSVAWKNLFKVSLEDGAEALELVR